MKNALNFKTILRIVGIVAMVAVIGFSMLACGGGDDGGDTSGDPTSATYTGYDPSGTAYKLVVSGSNRAATYTPKAGDTYVLTIGTEKSNGTVKSFSSNVLTLEKNGQEFYVTVSGTTIASISGSIPLDGGGTKTPPVLTPTKPGDGGTEGGGTDNGGLSVEMVQIPGGSFEMGKELNTESGYSDVTPVHTVTLTGFYMGKYEVTWEQYRAVMGSNPSTSKRPVENVSWYDAIKFCNKLSILEGLTPAYSISGSTNPSAWGSVPIDI